MSVKRWFTYLFCCSGIHREG